MKKLFATALIAASITGSVSAASWDKVGVKVGAQSTNVTTGTSKVGFLLGAFSTYHVKDSFSIRPEFLYSAQGAQNFDTGYIQVPVLAQWHFNQDRVRAYVGPYLAFAISTPAGFSAAGNTFDYGYSLGVSATIPASRYVAVDLRYNGGLGEVFTTATGFKNQTIALSVETRF